MPWPQFIGEAEAHTARLPYRSKSSAPAAEQRDMAPRQWSCTSAVLEGASWHMLGNFAKKLRQENVDTALPQLPDCLCTVFWNLYTMQIQKA